MTPRQEANEIALHFLALAGEDDVGVVGDLATLAAVSCYIDLERQGLVAHRVGPDGPIFHLTPAGRARTAASHEVPRSVQ